MARPWTLEIDPRERASRLYALAQGSDAFEVRARRLPVGDYLIAGAVLVERKTHSDFVASLLDGRLFPQATALARGPHRPLILLEGPAPERLPDVHPYALEGAMASLAVMWRLPVLQARDPEDSLRLFRFLASQAERAAATVLKRFGRKPKRIASRKLYVLQGLPGVGPALAGRLLARFGSIERVMAADETELTETAGVGPTKAARIRALVK
ncbi:MAG: helix-hairpin-helix domain-containing protein [Acidobacteriota bacterium]|nr:helix-hairpin-helix domain-containing protein [Acidobacteriota bacterium]